MHFLYLLLLYKEIFPMFSLHFLCDCVYCPWRPFMVYLMFEFGVNSTKKCQADSSCFGEGAFSIRQQPLSFSLLFVTKFYDYDTKRLKLLWPWPSLHTRASLLKPKLAWPTHPKSQTLRYYKNEDNIRASVSPTFSSCLFITQAKKAPVIRNSLEVQITIVPNNLSNIE